MKSLSQIKGEFASLESQLHALRCELLTLSYEGVIDHSDGTTLSDLSYILRDTKKQVIEAESTLGAIQAFL